MSTSAPSRTPHLTELPFLSNVSTDDANDPLLATAQSISVANGIYSTELAELANALKRRAADHPGLAHAPDAIANPNGGLLLVWLWTSIADVRAFVQDSSVDLRDWRKRTGLEPASERALWWTDGASPPGPEEARSRLSRLRDHGPGPHAFTLRSPVPPPR